MTTNTVARQNMETPQKAKPNIFSSQKQFKDTTWPGHQQWPSPTWRSRQTVGNLSVSQPKQWQFYTLKSHQHSGTPEHGNNTAWQRKNMETPRHSSQFVKTFQNVAAA